MKQEYLTDTFRKASNRVCTSTITVCPFLLSPTPLDSAMKTQKTQKRTLITLNKQVKEISKLNTLI